MAEEPQFRIPLDFLYDSICEKFKLGATAQDIKTYLRKAGIDPNTISNLLERYFQERNAEEQNDVLTDKPVSEEWYGGPIANPASHWSRLKDVLQTKKNWSSDMIESLDFGSTAVVAKILDPKVIERGDAGHVKGLVLGYVQSGKTANYSAVIAKAIDAGYKFIVVLAGVHNNLRYQTEVRLKEEIIDPNETTCVTLTRTDKKGDFSKTETTSANKACGQPSGFSMAVIKKNVAVLRTFYSWLEAAKPECLAKCPVLIIDDESDQASINTSKNPELNPSAINGAIRKIMSLFKIASYVGYTATPFANMLIDASVDDDLYPRDFFISLRKPPSYTGAEELFGSQDFDDRKVGLGLPIVREVDFEEANHVREISKPKSTDDFVLGEDLKCAIDGFLLACACRIARKHWMRHFTMLIHCTQRVSVQQQIHDQVQQYLDDVRFLYRKGDAALIARLERQWNDDYAVTTRMIDNEVEIQAFSAILKNLENVVDQLQLVLENSASEARLSYEEKFWGIVVGGNTLSRGLTLEGLMTSYFVRSSNYYDSLLQMGRWFGYRRGYLDLIRIYMTNDLKERFFHLANVETEIREEIHSMAENGDKPIDVGVRIRTLPGMSVTNAMKMRSAETNHISLSCTKVQPTFHNLSVAALRDSSQAVQGLLQNIVAYGGKRVESKFTRFQDSHLYRGVSAEVILQFLDDHEFSAANLKFNAKRISDYIVQAGETGELEDWSVAFVSKLKATRSVALSQTVRLGLSDRSISDGLLSELDPEARYVSRVSTPIDEFIDMGDLVQNCPSDVDAFATIEGPKHGIGYFRKKYRPKDRGLLLIYAINPDSQLDERLNSSSPYPLVPLKAPDVVYGVCFVFPETANRHGSTAYVVNRSIGKATPTSTLVRKSVRTNKKAEPKVDPDHIPDKPFEAKVIGLSKSRFQAGLQCEKRLYLECFHYDKRDVVTAAQDAVFTSGKLVGELARKRFPGGKLVDFDGFHQMEADAETKTLLSDSNVSSIYEAAFTYDNVKVRVDILVKVGPREVDLVEVKSSTRVKDEHYMDIAVQAHVVEGSGLKIRRCYLMHIDSSYVFDGGEYDLTRLFTLSEITNEVKDLSDTIVSKLKDMRTVLDSGDIPEVDTGSHCNKPYPCSFHGYCRKGWPQDHVSTLPRASDRLVRDLTAHKISRIRDIPENFVGLTAVQKRVRDCVVNDRPFYDLVLFKTLRDLGRPLYFIDFETLTSALPIFKGTRPYQQVPFQWSAHVMQNGHTDHHDFLAKGDSDPREEFVRSLLQTLKGDGPILVYSSFEATCLKALDEDFPDLASGINAVIQRLIDLLALIRQHFYHKDFGGSFSIKKVLPALVPDISYKELAIRDGATAAMSFARIASSDVGKEEAREIRNNLLAYCKLDTLAMVKIFERLLNEELVEIGRSA